MQTHPETIGKNKIGRKRAAPSVLIVDDISTNIDVLMQALEPLGYNISAAPSGEVALNLAPKLKPDIILLDVMMTGIDGFETCRRLKQDPQTESIPVIFITARNDVRDLMEGFSVGAVDYISKPFNFEEVGARVGIHYQNQMLLREREEMLAESKRLMDELSKKTELVTAAHNEALASNQQLKSAQAQLVHNEKMASLGEMVSGIGHEVNNPCNFIINNLSGLDKNVDKIKEILDQILSGDESGERVKSILAPYWTNTDDTISSIRNGAERIAAIVKSLRNFARHGEGDLKDVDLNEVSDGTIKIMAHLMNTISFEAKFGDIPTVACSPAQISQVIMNILGNAIYAAKLNKSGGKVVLSTHREGDAAVIKISDNGPGIPESARAKIFDPFFTTKPVGEGSGLGLSISSKIMLEHKGKLDYVSGPTGTTFSITLYAK